MWRWAEERTPAASRSALLRWRLAARAISPTRRGAVLHELEQAAEVFGVEAQVVAHGCERAILRPFVADDVEDEPGQKGFGFLVPMGFRDLARRVVDERVSDGGGIFGEVEAAGVQTVERIVRGGGQARDAEGVEHMDRAEPAAGLVRGAGVLAFGIGADGAAVGCEQVRDDGADALAGSGWGEAEKVGRAVVAQQPAWLAVGLDLAADDEAVAASSRPPRHARSMNVAEPCTSERRGGSANGTA